MARLFEQGTLATPDTDKKLAFGKAGEVTENITIANFLIWLQDVALSFLKPSNNLSDLQDGPTALTNIDAYSKGAIDFALEDKADKSNVLELDNTDVYNPTSNYNPATKVYVDNSFLTQPMVLYTRGWVSTAGVILLAGAPNGFTSAKLETGVYEITHNLNAINGYQVIVYPNLGSTDAIKTANVVYLANSFKVSFADDATLNDAQFRFTILRFPGL